MPIRKYGRVWLVLDYGNAIVGSKPSKKEAELADLATAGVDMNKLYKVTGYVYASYIEKDDFGDAPKRYEGEGAIDTAIIATNPGRAAELALKIWSQCNDWPLDSVSWIDGPQIELAPEDQQLTLINAPMLPGLEVEK